LARLSDCRVCQRVVKREPKVVRAIGGSSVVKQPALISESRSLGVNAPGDNQQGPCPNGPVALWPSPMPTMNNQTSRRRPFLTAEWRDLLMLNYPVERAVLEPVVPPGTVLDTYRGVAYVSVVGFQFLNTRVLGLAVPFHRDFEEVNLRFYVRRLADGDWRRGVVFIKEIVPKPVVAAIARAAYNESYVSLPMRHLLTRAAGGTLTSVEYQWDFKGRPNRMRAEVLYDPFEPAPGSLQEFITEHRWGYVIQRDGGCVEYEVEHPRWQIHRTNGATLDCDAAQLYGPQFAAGLGAVPTSAFLAEGSAVTIYRGVRI
jgi:uncharacterized protein